MSGLHSRLITRWVFFSALAFLLFIVGTLDLYATARWIQPKQRYVTVRMSNTLTESEIHSRLPLVDSITKEPIMTHEGSEQNPVMWRLMDFFGKYVVVVGGEIVLLLFCLFFPWFAMRLPEWEIRTCVCDVSDKIEKPEDDDCGGACNCSRLTCLVDSYNLALASAYLALWGTYVGFLVGHSYYGVASFKGRYFVLFDDIMRLLLELWATIVPW